MSGAPPSVLLAASYGMRVGYAWNNIYRLFNALMRAFHERGLRVCVSFREMDGPITVFDDDLPYQTFVFDPRRIARNRSAGCASRSGRMTSATCT